MKKDSNTEKPPATLAERQETVEEPQVAKGPSRRMPPLPVRPPNFPEIARRGEAPPGPLRPDAVAARDKSLVIGKEVRLKGEILACDKMIVEGDAEITLTGGRHLLVGASGRFRGTADVVEADIGGHFEGELAARERLTVRPSGRIHGTVRYAQINIEAGGQISGQMAMLDGARAGTGDQQLATRALIAPTGAEAVSLAERP